MVQTGDLEADVDAAIALCGDERGALRSCIVLIGFLDAEVERLRALISKGYARGIVDGLPPTAAQ